MSNTTPRPASGKTVSVRRPRFLQSYVPLLILMLGITAIAVAFLVGTSDNSPKKTGDTASACGNYRNDGQVRINGAVFNVELPRDADAFNKGLGGRPCILPNQGMLFAFNVLGQYKFWMKDMKFPIDIIWINSLHKVAALEIDVEPSTYNSSHPIFVNDTNHLAQYVLEIKANLSKSLHIGLGTLVSFQNT